MTVIMPADYHATKKLVREAASLTGPTYLRFTRDPVPLIYDEAEEFEIGKGKILISGHDVSLIAIGDMLSITLQAQEMLLGHGIVAEVIDIHTIKPIDRELIINSAQKTRHVVTIEDHQISCGLGSAVAEVLGENLPTKMRRIGLRDTFAESGEYYLLLQKYCMDADAIVNATLELLEV
jgi:transketolase